MGLTPSVLEDLTGAFTRDVGYANPATWQSLHSADPGLTGANEITNGMGAEARQLVGFASGGSGTDTNPSQVIFTIGSPTMVTWIGYWTAETGGTFLGGFPIIGSQMTAVGISGGQTIYCPGHGLSQGQAVRPYPIAGLLSSMPAPLTSDVQFIVYATLSVDEIILIHAGGIPITLASSGGFCLARDLSQTTTLPGEQLIFSANSGIVFATVS